MFLIDDDYVDNTPTRAEPTKQQLNALKVFIKQFVAGRGHKASIKDVCEAAHVQFPGAFTFGELESACAELQADWYAKRAAKEAAKGNPV